MGILDTIADKFTGKHTGALKRLQEAQTAEFTETAGRVPSDADLAGLIDPPDPLPGEDCAQDRDHFPDTVTEEEIDSLLQSIEDDPHFIKHGRPADPDNDPENFNDDDPDDDDHTNDDPDDESL